ncbi:DNA N-6-adenine-methyltransferase [Bacillus paranthracis]
MTSKMDVHFSGKTDLWATPQYFFDELHKEFDFELDVCALEDNAKCEKVLYSRNGRIKTGVEWYMLDESAVWSRYRKMG